MLRVKPFALVALLLALIPLNAPVAAAAAGVNQFVGFGDSNLDSGYFRYHTTGNAATDAAVAAAVAGGAAGGFAGNGVASTVQLAGRFGLSAAPIGGGGTNYAIGGSYAAVDTPVLVSAVRQIRNYLASVNGAANPDALYVIKSGDNDLTYVTNQGAAWIAANPGYLNQQASALAAEIAALQTAGARTIIMPNSVNYGVSAALGGGLDPANAAAYARSVAYGSALWSDLAEAGVNFVPADIDSVIRYVVQNPTLFGFTAASVLAANAPSPVSALVAILTPAQQQDYLFIDGKHLTTAGQTIVADYEYSLLIAPSQVSLLAESAVQSGLAFITSIQGQIDLPAEASRNGRNQRLDQRRGRQPENQERVGLSGSFRHSLRRHGRTGLPDVGRGHSGHGDHGGGPEADVLHGRALRSDGRGREPLCGLRDRAGVGECRYGLRPVSGQNHAARAARSVHR